MRFQTKMHHLAQQYGPFLKKYDVDFSSLYDYRDMKQEDFEKEVNSLIRLFSLATIKTFASSHYAYFFVLHLVTSFRALKMVILNMKSEEHNSEEQTVTRKAKLDALSYFWKAIVFAYTALERPAVENITLEKVLQDEEQMREYEEQTNQSKSFLENKPGHCDWDKVIKRVINQEDEHVVKLAFVCYKEAQEYADLEDLFYNVAINTIVRFERDGWK